MGSSESSQRSDDDVVRLVRAGDVDAFEVLVERHQEHVMRVVARNAPRADAAELAHEAFVKAYLSLERYRGSHPFAHWLARIALRCCSDHWRKHYREDDRRDALEDTQATAAGGEPDADRELLERALARLDARDRRVLTLVYFEGLSIREVAELLEWSEANVKVRAHRARKRLRSWLEGARTE